jgi:hypothetical protein
MKACKNCGKETQDRALFCPVCGLKDLMSKEEHVDDLIMKQQSKKKGWVKYLAVALGVAIVISVVMTVTIFLMGREAGEKVADAVEVELDILRPEDNTTSYIDSATQETLDLNVEIACEGNPERIDVYLDDQIKATLVQEPYVCVIRGIKGGSYIIRAEAKGDSEEVLASSNIKIKIEKQGEDSEASQPSEPSASAYFNDMTLMEHNNAQYSYTISYPAGWTREEEVRKYGYRTKWWSPDRSMYFLVDSSRLKPGETDPCETAYSLDREFIKASTQGYVNYGINRETFKGWPSCRYELGYISSENDFFPGQAIRKYDYFINGSRYGYAVLFAARPGDYEKNLQGFIDVILGNFEPES